MIDCVRSNQLHTLCKPFLTFCILIIFHSCLVFLPQRWETTISTFYVGVDVNKTSSFPLFEEKTLEPKISPLAKTSSRLRTVRYDNFHISERILQTSFVKSHHRKDIVITMAAMLWCQPDQFYSKKWPFLWGHCVLQAPDFRPCTPFLFGQVRLFPHLHRGILPCVDIWE